jgi:hypothetical protein
MKGELELGRDTNVSVDGVYVLWGTIARGLFCLESLPLSRLSCMYMGIKKRRIPLTRAQGWLWDQCTINRRLPNLVINLGLRFSPLLRQREHLEYDNTEGMILLSELSHFHIHSIQNLIRVDRNQVVVARRVDKLKKRTSTYQNVASPPNRSSKAKVDS